MKAIISALCKKIGLDPASVGIGAIERATRQRIVATKSPGIDHYRRLVTESPRELAALIDAIVVPETWFLRDPGAFAAVASHAAQSDPMAKLNYLCVPCATGEEPYSLAMTLLDAGIPADRFQIDACDISEPLLECAARGLYRRHSFRGNDAAIRGRYFRETAEGCAILPVVRRQVTFRQANLLDDSALIGAHIYDAIFCRNLLIYFQPDAQSRAIDKVSRLLRHDGLLCVAPAETGLLLRYGLAPAEMPQAFAFHNRRRAPAPKSRQQPQPRLLLPPPSAPAEIKPRAALAPAPVPEPKKETVRPAVLADAQRLANEGRFEEVSGLCRAYIEQHGASADAYYLLALVCDASARYDEASTLYRKTLYLDPEHQEALAHFSLLSDKLGETATAGALRRRALRLESSAA